MNNNQLAEVAKILGGSEDSISVMSLCDVERDGNPFTAIKNKIKVLTSPINIGNAVWHGRIQKDIDLD